MTSAKSPSRMEMEREAFQAAVRWLEFDWDLRPSGRRGYYEDAEANTAFSIWLAARERPDEVVVAEGTLDDEYNVWSGPVVAVKIEYTRNTRDLAALHGQHVAVVVRKSEGEPDGK